MGHKKKEGGKKKKAPTLHSRNFHDICFSSSKTKYVLRQQAALASARRKEAVKSVVFSGQRQVAHCPWFSPSSAAPAPDLPPVLRGLLTSTKRGIDGGIEAV